MNIKNFQVDLDNPTEIKKLIHKLTSLRKKKLKSMGYVQSNFHTSRWNFNDIFPILEHMYECDISGLYENESDETKNSYVYFHCDPTNKLSVSRDIREAFLAIKFNLEHLPFYVGKGVGNRAFDLNRNDSHRKIRSKILKKGKDIVPVIISDKLTESEALIIESKLIDILGLKYYSNKGFLINLDEGNSAMERRALYGDNSKIQHILKMNGFLK